MNDNYEMQYYSTNDEKENNYSTDHNTEQKCLQPRYCKRCGCPMAATSTYDECESCRRQKADKVKKGAMAAAGLIAVISIVGKLLSGSSDKD